MRTLWRRIYGGGETCGYMGLFCGTRPAPGSGELLDPRSAYFEYPHRIREAEAWCTRRSAEGREAYFCAHLLTVRMRIKEYAAPVLALWADADGAASPTEIEVPSPTAVVESSPGRRHLFWRLRYPIPPYEAEALNRRLSYAIGADRSGWKLGQLLRPPGTRNHKYEVASAVKLLEIADDRYHPREIEMSLPQETTPRLALRSPRPESQHPAPDLGRLSGRMRALISYGNRGEYPSRSEADFAACLAMLIAGYSANDVWTVMADPAHGISEKHLEKGRHGEAYLSLTIGKASALTGRAARARASLTHFRPSPPGPRKEKAGLSRVSALENTEPVDANAVREAPEISAAVCWGAERKPKEERRIVPCWVRRRYIIECRAICFVHTTGWSRTPNSTVRA